MTQNGPILIIDDNPEERRLIQLAMEHLQVKNELVFFENGEPALKYLLHVEKVPFIIICDIDMPVMNGLELSQRIFENAFLKKKSIPFIFRTGSATDAAVSKAYDMTVQGVFIKSEDFHALEQQIQVILQYWRMCIPPPV